MRGTGDANQKETCVFAGGASSSPMNLLRQSSGWVRQCCVDASAADPSPTLQLIEVRTSKEVCFLRARPFFN